MWEKYDKFISRFGGIFIILLIATMLSVCVLPIISYYLSLFPRDDLFEANRTIPQEVASAFVLSIAFNEVENINSYVSEERQETVDKLLSEHKPLSRVCRFPLDPDHHGMTFGGSERDGKSNIALFYYFDCPGYDYFLDADLELAEFSDGWRIIAWEKLCEKRGSRSKCWQE